MKKYTRKMLCEILEDNTCGQLISNINSPSDCRGDGHTILVGSAQNNLTV